MVYNAFKSGTFSLPPYDHSKEPDQSGPSEYYERTSTWESQTEILYEDLPPIISTQEESNIITKRNPIKITKITNKSTS